MLSRQQPIQKTPTGYLALVQTNPDFRNLWFGQIISLFGDWFNLIASAALISQLTQSGLAVGGLFVVRMLAPFLISPVAGVAADRYNRKRLLILADLARATVVLGFLLVRSAEHVWLLYALTAVQLAISGFFFPARNAILPDIVDRRELGAANALSSATWSVMLAIGAALGGLVAGGWGIYPAFIIDSLTFLLSAFFISRVGYEWKPELLEGGRSIVAAARQYLEGLNYLGKSRDILVISLQKAAIAFAVNGIFNVVQVILAEQVFVYGEGGGTSLGLMYAVAGVGTGLGPILTRFATGDRNHSLRKALAWSYVLNIAGLAISAPLLNFPLLLAGIFLRTLGSGINWVFSTQLLLQLVPDRVRGRVFSTEFALFTLSQAVSTALGGWLLDRTALTLPQLFWVMAGLTVVPGLLWVAWMYFGTPAAPLAESEGVSSSAQAVHR